MNKGKNKTNLIEVIEENNNEDKKEQVKEIDNKKSFKISIEEVGSINKKETLEEIK